MNILLFVISMLTVFSILTYGRLESYRNFALVQKEFLRYMKEKERKYVNEEAIKIYNDRYATSREVDEKQKIKKSNACSRLSFRPFIDKKAREADPQALENNMDVALKLMDFLYKDRPFYKEMEEKRPNFLREIISNLIKQTEGTSFADKIEKTKELATIDLEDRELNTIFTKMLKGTIRKRDKPKVYEDYTAEEETKIKETPANDSSLLPRHDYYSLLDFITIENKKQIRVYLASEQLLMTLFGYKDIVKKILESRYGIYKDLSRGKDTMAAEEEFKSLFLNQKLPFVPEGMLDFSISKTNPRKYD